MGVSEIHWYSPKTAIEHRKKQWLFQNPHHLPLKSQCFRFFGHQERSGELGWGNQLGRRWQLWRLWRLRLDQRRRHRQGKIQRRQREKAKDQSLGWIWSLLSWKSFIPSRKINVKWSKGSPFLGRFYCWAYPIKCWCSCVLLIVWWEKWSKWMMSWPSRWHLKLITAGERLHAFS